MSRSLRASHQLQLDGRAHQDDGQQPGGGHLDDGLPGGVAGLTPGFEQVAQFPDITRGMAVFQAEVGQAPLGAAFSGAGEQVVQIFRAQMGGP